MRGEIYQLVAIDKYNNEKVIELNNNNKDSKCLLSFIDSITTSIPNEEALILYLIEKGKIDNKNVRLVIRYNYSTTKYLPVIYNESELNSIALRATNEKDRKSYANFFIDKITLLSADYDFGNYLIALNNSIFSEISNGNYLNNHILEEFERFYSVLSYSYGDEDLSRKEKNKNNLKKCISDYKSIRTLYIFYNHYLNTKGNKTSENAKYDIPECVKYIVPREEIKEEIDIPEYLQKAYKQGGMDAVYALIDNDEVIRKGYKFK